jgi:hypothetical protein
MHGSSLNGLRLPHRIPLLLERLQGYNEEARKTSHREFEVMVAVAANGDVAVAYYSMVNRRNDD